MMQQKQSVIILTMMSLLMISWVLIERPSIQQSQCLIGIWENKTARGVIQETWTRSSDHSFSGKSCMIRGADTILLETIQLLQEKDSLFYIPTVTNQNGGLPVRFTAVHSGTDQLVFENPNHDFPQRIVYTRIHADSMVAEISGKRNGQERKQFFPMKRIR